MAYQRAVTDARSTVVTRNRRVSDVNDIEEALRAAGLPLPAVGEPRPTGELIGTATSCDGGSGDPSRIGVFPRLRKGWWVERATGRVDERGQALSVEDAERLAALADRAQLTLGFPVSLEWVLSDGGPQLLGAEALDIAANFLPGRWRLVSLVGDDEGVVAPITADTLDRALRHSDFDELELSEDEVRVRAIYARPYRNLPKSQLFGEEDEAAPFSIATLAAGSAIRAVVELERLQLARKRNYVTYSLPLDTNRMSTARLFEVLKKRQFEVARALRDLDRARLASHGLIRALGLAVGTLSHHEYTALAVAKSTRRRRLLDEANYIDRAGIQQRSTDPDLGFAGERPWGMDIATPPFGESPELYATAFSDSQQFLTRQQEVRTETIQKVLRRAAPGPRRTVARSVTMLLERVARVKGIFADRLCDTQLSFRSALLDVGTFVEREHLLDEPEDIFYLMMQEISDILEGEPGAYSARVMLRKEEAMRWKHYRVPRKIGP